MFICPQCNVPLTSIKSARGIFWRCPACDGRSATLSLLRREIPAPVVNALWQSARSGSFPRKRACPACSRLMAEVPSGGEQKPAFLDVCTICQFVWFDRNEYTALPGRPEPVDPKTMLPPAAREKLALIEIDAIRQQAEDSNWGGNAPDTWWQWIPALLGMPVEHDAGSIRALPWATWGLAALITAASLLAFFDLPTAIARFGLIPAQSGRDGGLTFLTSFFLHGGLFHLLGNMYFFLVFGDNVEDWLGKRRFFLLILCAALAGDIFHILGDPCSTIPCIGASGGISGVVAFYALKFPRAKLGLLIHFYFVFRWLRLPASLLFLAWLGLQFLGAMTQISGFGNVSSLAHLGGAAVGLAFSFASRND